MAKEKVEFIGFSIHKNKPTLCVDTWKESNFVKITYSVRLNFKRLPRGFTSMLTPYKVELNLYKDWGGTKARNKPKQYDLLGEHLWELENAIGNQLKKWYDKDPCPLAMCRRAYFWITDDNYPLDYDFEKNGPQINEREKDWDSYRGILDFNVIDKLNEKVEVSEEQQKLNGLKYLLG